MNTLSLDFTILFEQMAVGGQFFQDIPLAVGVVCRWQGASERYTRQARPRNQLVGVGK